MAQICPNCGSPSTEAGLDSFHCVDCGADTTYKGEAREPGLRYTSEIPPSDLANAKAALTSAEEQGIDVNAVLENEADSTVPGEKDLARLVAKEKKGK